MLVTVTDLAVLTMYADFCFAIWAFENSSKLVSCVDSCMVLMSFSEWSGSGLTVVIYGGWLMCHFKFSYEKCCFSRIQRRTLALENT
jgi:hypothetical protein